MYTNTILVKQDKTIVASHFRDIYEGEKNADEIQFLFDKSYFDNITNYSLMMHIIFPYQDLLTYTPTTYEIRNIEVEDELYKNKYRAVVPITDDFTMASGEIQIWFTVKNIDNPEIGVTKTDTYSFEILPNRNTSQEQNMFDSIERNEDYSYLVSYSNIDYDFANEYFKTKEAVIPGGCTAIRNHEFFGRDYDWEYSETAEFVVRLNATKDRYASISVCGSLDELTDDFVKSQAYSDAYRVLPFMVTDGMNEKQVAATINVVPNEKGENITKTVPLIDKKESVCALALIRYILDNFDDAYTAAEYIRDYVEIYFTQSLIDMGYKSHWMIADLYQTVSLEVVQDEVKIEIMTKPFMTNFYLWGVDFNPNLKIYTPETQTAHDNAYNTNHVTLHGCGLERYNNIVNIYPSTDTLEEMQDLMIDFHYSNAYKRSTAPFWYTEFVGINGLTVKSSVQDYEEVVPNIINKFNHRSRKKDSPYYGTWHSVHTSVYDLETKSLYLMCQESGEYKEFKL